MPELPEVETIRTQIAKILPLKIVSEMRSQNIESLTRKAKSQELFNPVSLTLYKITRYGKLLIFHFKNHVCTDYRLLNGLGMSGGWRISRKKLTLPHTHLLWKATDLDNQNLYLGYIDPRRFGMLAFIDKKKVHEKISTLGIDISTKQFNEDYLKNVFEKFPNKELKPFLLDQKYFAGVGNYIASEICARAGIMPTRLLAKIKKHELSKIIKASKVVISGAQNLGGLTFSGGYSDTTGSDGGGLKHLVVFHQKICGLCHKTPVIKIELKKRGTFYCPHCQK